ncbi:10865_t:CDS:2 [Diversispora eburnea]|uniref:10865_t:CDS:1 n=1 Tax=Diversispora eburnea TaxID=1213867 RepID=A0A9N9BV61_9GLOM|nr:10865_t:CDS:2 [Diversispora eburnea]
MIDLANYHPAIDALKVISPSLVWFHFAPLSLNDGVAESSDHRPR